MPERLVISMVTKVRDAVLSIGVIHQLWGYGRSTDTGNVARPVSDRSHRCRQLPQCAGAIQRQRIASRKATIQRKRARLNIF